MQKISCLLASDTTQSKAMMQNISTNGDLQNVAFLFEMRIVTCECRENYLINRDNILRYSAEILDKLLECAMIALWEMLKPPPPAPLNYVHSGAGDFLVTIDWHMNIVSTKSVPMAHNPTNQTKIIPKR